MYAIAEANRRIDELTRRVAELERLVAQLQRGTPPHLANVERREFKPTINGAVAGPVVEAKS